MSDPSPFPPKAPASRPPEVPVLPVPCAWDLAPVTLRDQAGGAIHAARLTLWTPTGEHVTFWTLDDLERLAARCAEVRRIGTAARLDVPPAAGRLIVPGANGGS